MAERITGSLEEQIQNPTENTQVLSKSMEGLAPGQYSDKLSERIADLTKGRKGGYSDDHAVFADLTFRNAIQKSRKDPQSVVKGLSPQFAAAIGAAMNSPQNTAMADLASQIQQVLSAELGKNVTLTAPLASGLVPYDLTAPAKLIYPVYSPLRNLIPRTPGHGTSHKAKIIDSVSGSAVNSLAVPGNRISISELPGGGSLSNWPINLPGSGTQHAFDISVPYKFFGLTESVSWLAQFSGQGFEDAEGLANLILAQEMMMLEERAIISATATAVATPGAPGASARTAHTGEAANTGVTTNVYVAVTAVNFYGETAASAIATAPWSAGDVVDVTITPSSGALAYNIYTATGASAPAIGTFKLYAAGVGATVFTITGALGAGANPPASDTGTSSANDYEGLIPTISGHSAGGVYPAGYQGSYVNQSVNDTLSVNALDAAFNAMWNGANGVYADPDFLLAEGTDLGRLGSSLAQAGTQTAGYRMFVSQDEVQNIRSGSATREIVNPVTQKIVPMKVHPYLPQGTAALISMKLPQPQQNVSNVWENVMVQDYLSISWPVIDVSYRKSMFMYGALFSPAVQWNGLLQGIQKTVATASAGTNS